MGRKTLDVTVLHNDIDQLIQRMSHNVDDLVALTIREVAAGIGRAPSIFYKYKLDHYFKDRVYEVTGRSIDDLAKRLTRRPSSKLRAAYRKVQAESDRKSQVIATLQAKLVLVEKNVVRFQIDPNELYKPH